MGDSCGIDNDVFDEDATNEELDLADREFKQRLTTIKTSAFHESFEPAKERCLQQAFDTGYGLIYKPFQSISMLEGIYDSAYHSFLSQTEDTSEQEDIKAQFASLYSEVFDSFNEKIDADVECKAVIARTYQPTHIVPSAELVDRFNAAKQKTLDLCQLAGLNHLCAIVESVQL